MKRVSLVTAAVLMACGAVLAACGGGDKSVDDALGPGQTPVDSSNTKVTGMIAQLDAGQAAASSAASSGGQGAPSGSASNAPPAQSCTFADSTMSFYCPTITQPNGMVYKMRFQLLDSAGAPQAHFDTVTTRAVKRITDRSGTVNQPLMTQNGPVPATQTMSEHVEMTLSNIRPGLTPEQNGNGVMTNSIVPTGLASATMTVTETFEHIVIDPAPGAPKYPKSGKVTVVMVSQTGTAPQVTTTQVTTYDGTATATTVITLPGGAKRTCTYSMTANPPVPPTCTP
ncbi:MAG TPA: hypothetical protein VF483_08635 [Gemmatimonadaceae bacterium]